MSYYEQIVKEVIHINRTDEWRITTIQLEGDYFA